ncbi:MAG: response regulator [Clostridiaceae bacterium]|nr:response regulator [Clostridiaceae bacterium]
MYKLLLVDDENGQLTALEYILNQLRPEYEVYTATDGQEALEVLASNKIDILFTDIRMPIVDGLQLVEKLFKRSMQLKAVIISGYDEFEYAQKAIRYGVKDYLVKPVSKSDLKNVLCKIENILEEERNVKVQVEELKKKAR